VLYAALAAVVGVVIVAVGGGIRTMASRWEAVANRYDDEKPRIAEAVRNAPSLSDQARQGQRQARDYARDAQPGTSSRGIHPYEPQPERAPALTDRILGCG
jgi:hypothetical protein